MEAKNKIVTLKQHTLLKVRIILAFTMLTIFLGCKEKEPLVDKCSNGFVDAGETGIDCGGKCPPCEVINHPSLYLEINGTPLSMSGKSIVLNSGNYILTASNDSLVVKFNLGNNLQFGTFLLDPNGTFTQLNGIFYLNASNGVRTISSNDSIYKTVNGFTQADLTRTGYTDTLKIRNCQFDYLPYP